MPAKKTTTANIHMFLVFRGEREEKTTMIDTERSVIFGLQFELFIDGWQISPIVSPVFHSVLWCELGDFRNWVALSSSPPVSNKKNKRVCKENYGIFLQKIFIHIYALLMAIDFTTIH